LVSNQLRKILFNKNKRHQNQIQGWNLLDRRSKLEQRKTEKNKPNSNIDEHDRNKLLSILKFGKKAIGRADLEKFLQGHKTTRAGALKAKCYDCMCGYADGIKDCGVSSCPMYPFHPYRGSSR
jgi:hypothetical protein